MSSERPTANGPAIGQAIGQAIGTAIQAAHRILIVGHIAPDGDAAGSVLGLGGLLRAQGKEVTLALQDGVPDGYDWLPGADEIVRQAEGACDLVISVDCSDPSRMGRIYQGELTALPLINIDHHITNTGFGTINWVDPGSAATTQMVLTLARALDWEVTPAVAECLLTGLITDTRSFRTSNVDGAALQAALDLVQAGASLSQIARRALDQRPWTSTQLWAQAIGDARLEEGVLWTAVTREMQHRWNAQNDGFSGLANFLSGVREADVVVVFTEQSDGTVDVGMRAVPGIDVAQVALKLGGGGHPQASGCTLSGSLAEVQEKVLAEVAASLQEQRARKL